MWLFSWKTFVCGSKIFSCIWFMLHRSRTTARRWCGFMTLPGVLMTSLTVVHGDCHLWDISTYSSKSGMSSFTFLRTVLLFTYFGHVWHSSFHSTASSAATPVDSIGACKKLCSTSSLTGNGNVQNIFVLLSVIVANTFCPLNSRCPVKVMELPSLTFFMSAVGDDMMTVMDWLSM